MAITEVFPNPTVKQVIFQIRYPNLFFIESRIGDLQIKLMETFPQSALVFRTKLVVADLGPGAKMEDVAPDAGGLATKIWQFKSTNNCELNIVTDSLDISSTAHKTYNNEPGPKFRDLIDLVLKAFAEVMNIPVYLRVGLRYVDECPVPSKNNVDFRAYYDSAFPLDRFNLAQAFEMDFKTLVTRGEHRLRYIESLRCRDDGCKLMLDFDGFAEKVRADDCLAVTDTLHDIISAEYERTIKDPVYAYMRQAPEA